MSTTTTPAAPIPMGAPNPTATTGNGNGKTVKPAAETVSGLHPNHYRELTEGSGLTVDTIRGARIYSEHDFRRLAVLLNRKSYGRKMGAALVFPYFDETGAQVNVSVKPNNPAKDSRGRLRKYLQPNDSQPRLYVPPGARQAIEEPGIRLLITEGEKKALKATQEGFAAVSISGVEGWHRKRSVRLIADLERIEWKGLEVFIVFDSDATEKEGVKSNEELLASVLANHGAVVKVVRLSAGANGEKVGLDDYLVANGPESFAQLLSDAEEPSKPEPGSMKLEACELDPATEAEAILESDKHDGLRRLVYWRGSMHYWKDGAYRELENSEVRARMIRRLNRSYRKLSSGVVNNVIDQVKAQALFPFAVDPPAWLDGQELCRLKEAGENTDLTGHVSAGIVNQVRKLYGKLRWKILWNTQRMPKAFDPRIRFRERAIRIVRQKWSSPTGSRQVRIGVDAPKSFHILREELLTDGKAD